MPPAEETTCFTIASPAPCRGRRARGRRGRSARRAAGGRRRRRRRRRRRHGSRRLPLHAARRASRRSGASVTDRVLGEVARDHTHHPAGDLCGRFGSTVDVECHAGSCRPPPRAPPSPARHRETGSAPRATTRVPDFQLREERTSSISSRIWSTSRRACSTARAQSPPAAAARASSRRASGVRGSCGGRRRAGRGSSWRRGPRSPRGRRPLLVAFDAVRDDERALALEPLAHRTPSRIPSDYRARLLAASSDSLRRRARRPLAALLEPHLAPNGVCIDHFGSTPSPLDRPFGTHDPHMAKVLIIEDDDVITQGVARRLTAAGFDAVGVANGERPRRLQLRAARRLRTRPDTTGFDRWRVIEQARGRGFGHRSSSSAHAAPARPDQHTRARALTTTRQAVSMKELTAHVAAAARRGHERRSLARRGDRGRGATARPARCPGLRGRRSAELTPTSSGLFMRSRSIWAGSDTRRAAPAGLGRPASHRHRTVDVFVRKLREKIDARSSAHTFVQTRYGVGSGSTRLRSSYAPTSRSRRPLGIEAPPRGDRGYDTERLPPDSVSAPRDLRARGCVRAIAARSPGDVGARAAGAGSAPVETLTCAGPHARVGPPAGLRQPLSPRLGGQDVLDRDLERFVTERRRGAAIRHRRRPGRSPASAE